MIPARIEQATFCVLSRRDNHYTTEPWVGEGSKMSWTGLGEIYLIKLSYFDRKKRYGNLNTYYRGRRVLKNPYHHICIKKH